MSSTKPAILFVPGAWHSPVVFNPVVKLLETAGYKTDLVHLASVGPSQHLPNFDKDVERIRDQIKRLADDGNEVMVLVHSYGSLPTNEAIKGLDLASRKAEGKAGGVSHLFFCCSFVIPEGKSLIAAFGGNDLPWFQISEDRMEVNPATPVETFYNDMSEEDAKRAVADLKPHSYQTFHSSISSPAWKVVPSTYLYCLKDEAIPIGIQKMMVEEIGKGVEFRTETIDTSHSPFFTAPNDVAGAIRRAAGETV